MNDEIVWILLLLLLFWGLPLILAITALVKTGTLRRQLADLHQELLRRTLPTPPPLPVQPRPETASTPAPAPAPKTAPEPEIQPPPAAPSPTRPPQFDPGLPPPSPASSPFNEILVGGKLASFAGIGLVLIGIALLIGYAVRHAWFGPGARVLLGLLSGAACVALGHLAETKGNQKLGLLARSLTGGGAAIFYFCVFAAHSYYDLISLPLAALTLFLSAAATLGLAVAYRSQAVAVIGVLGAFLLPGFLDDLADNRLFLLSYIALINLPVLLLGLQRKWQILYNLAFTLTLLLTAALALSRSAPHRDGLLLLTFAFIFFLEFTALGLLKLRHERDIRGRTADILRLLLNTLALLALLHADFDALELSAWTAPAFLALALLHIGFVRIGWTLFPAFALDNLALLIGALTCASLALPVQLDGAWVSTGWALEGLILCAFALRAKIPLLQILATLLGLLGLMKSMVFDLQFYPAAPELFLNARFASGLISALLLGAQGWLHRRHTPAGTPAASAHAPLLLGTGLLALLAVFTADLFWTLGPRDPAPWLLSTLFLLLTGITAAFLARTEETLSRLALLLLGFLPLKLLIDLLVLHDLNRALPLFLNTSFLALAALALLTLLLSRELPRRDPFPTLIADGTYPVFLNLAALAAAILTVTAEFYRIDSDWSQTAVTIWWAAAAMALVLFGLLRTTRPHRRAGLALFTLTTAKVLLVDMSELHGLDRITAFLTAGILLLILSFLYQRAASRLLTPPPAS